MKLSSRMWSEKRSLSLFSGRKIFFASLLVLALQACDDEKGLDGSLLWDTEAASFIEEMKKEWFTYKEKVISRCMLELEDAYTTLLWDDLLRAYIKDRWYDLSWIQILAAALGETDCRMATRNKEAHGLLQATPRARTSIIQDIRNFMIDYPELEAWSRWEHILRDREVVGILYLMIKQQECATLFDERDDFEQKDQAKLVHMAYNMWFYGLQWFCNEYGIDDWDSYEEKVFEIFNTMDVEELSRWQKKWYDLRWISYEDDSSPIRTRKDVQDIKKKYRKQKIYAWLVATGRNKQEKIRISIWKLREGILLHYKIDAAFEAWE